MSIGSGFFSRSSRRQVLESGDDDSSIGLGSYRADVEQAPPEASRRSPRPQTPSVVRIDADKDESMSQIDGLAPAKQGGNTLGESHNTISSRLSFSSAQQRLYEQSRRRIICYILAVFFAWSVVALIVGAIVGARFG